MPFEQAKLDFVTAWEEYAGRWAASTPWGSRRAWQEWMQRWPGWKWISSSGGWIPFLALEVDQARLNLQTRQIQAKHSWWRRSTGKSSQIGVVTGSQVTAFQNILTLAAPQAMEITAIPFPDELVDLGVGMTVTVRLSTQPGQGIYRQSESAAYPVRQRLRRGSVQQ